MKHYFSNVFCLYDIFFGAITLVWYVFSHSVRSALPLCSGLTSVLKPSSLLRAKFLYITLIAEELLALAISQIASYHF